MYSENRMSGMWKQEIVYWWQDTMILWFIYPKGNLSTWRKGVVDLFDLLDFVKWKVANGCRRVGYILISNLQCGLFNNPLTLLDNILKHTYLSHALYDHLHSNHQTTCRFQQCSSNCLCSSMKFFYYVLKFDYCKSSHQTHTKNRRAIMISWFLSLSAKSER